VVVFVAGLLMLGDTVGSDLDLGLIRPQHQLHLDPVLTASIVLRLTYNEQMLSMQTQNKFLLIRDCCHFGFHIAI
jgi:hypothetical protein